MLGTGSCVGQGRVRAHVCVCVCAQELANAEGLDKVTRALAAEAAQVLQ